METIELRGYLESKKYHNMVTSKVHLIKKYPELESSILKIHKGSNFSGTLYCFLNDIKYPICKHCGYEHKFISFKKGFLKYCDKQCDRNIIKYENKQFLKISHNEVKTCDTHNTIMSMKIFDLLAKYGVECFCEKCSLKIRAIGEYDNNIVNSSKKKLKNVLINQKVHKEKIVTYFPNLYLKVESIKNVKPNNFFNRLNVFVFDLNLECKTINCKNNRSFNKFRKLNDYCSTCRRSESGKDARKIFQEKYWINYIKNNFNTHVSKININEKELEILNYCEHHNNLKILKYDIKNLKQKGIHSLCQDCNKLYYSNNIINSNYPQIKNKWNKIKHLSENKLMINNPYVWGAIIELMSKRNVDFKEAKFIARYDIKSTPICNHSKCNKSVEFSSDAYDYLMYCKDHSYSSHSSSGEQEVYDFIKSLNIKLYRNARNIIDKELDIYIPEYNLAIEYNGLYWHSDKFKNKNYHNNKVINCNANKIQLITIWEDDWKYKQDIIKSIIRNKLKLNKNKVYARNTNIKLLDSYEKKNFLNQNHIQGNVNSSLNFGLFYNNELVSLMTFGKKRMVLNSKSTDSEYELLRFCNKLNTSVIGGASKLFKYFIINYNPINIVSYANLDISNGSLYEILKFKQTNSNINYWWTDGSKKYHRSNFMKHKLVDDGYDPNLTENEIMKSRGYNKIYGTGNLKYIWTL